MDEILISGDMPRTLYSNNDVSPSVHRMRALGGPIFNLTGLLLSLAIYGVVSSNSIIKELAGWWALGHGLQLIMSLSPLPFVDGGTILKCRGEFTVLRDDGLGFFVGFGDDVHDQPPTSYRPENEALRAANSIRFPRILHRFCGLAFMASLVPWR